MRLLVMLMLLWTLPLEASEFRFLELESLCVDYMKYFPGGRDPLVTANGLPNKQLGDELDVTIHSRVARYLYWDNWIHSTTDLNTFDQHGQFRSLGLEMRFGVRFSRYIDFGYYHHSQHVLDTTNTNFDFPVKDALQLRIYLYNNKREDTLIP